MLRLTSLLLCVTWFVGTAAANAAEPLRLIVEAEDFEPVEGDWSVRHFGSNYFASTKGFAFLSGGRYLSAPEQGKPSRAVREIDIPRDCELEVWARYEHPYEYATEFNLEVQQDGQKVFEHGYGRRDGVKLWAYQKGFQRQALYDHGPGDNIVWEGRGAKVRLKKGRATLILKKDKQSDNKGGGRKSTEDEQYARRNVDVIILTDDQAGIERELNESKTLPLDSWIEDPRKSLEGRIVEQDLEELAKKIKTFKRKGKRPEKYLIAGIMSDGDALNRKDRVGELSREIAAALGSNTLPEIEKPAKNGAVDVSSVTTNDLAAYCQRLKDSGTADRLRVVIDDYNPLANQKKRTEIFEANLPEGVVVGSKRSSHPHYWPKESEFVQPFKERALTLPWSGDAHWQVPEFSPQIVGYEMAALRCGAKYHNQPIMCNISAHYPGNTPSNLRRAYYTAIGHGAKMINFQGATPASVASGDDYARSDAANTWRTIHDIVQETGEFEYIAFDAKPRPARVALLMSATQDKYETEPAYNHERKCIYYALRHTAIGVDFLTEADVQDGKFGSVKVLYVVGNHLETKTARALQDWVRTGGVLVGVAGGGFFNEHNKPMDTLHEVYGVSKTKLERRDTNFMTKLQLPRLNPLDTVTYPSIGRKFPALAFKQKVELTPAAKVHANFTDGSPAITEYKFGGGTAFLYNTFAASAYIRGGIPKQPWERGTRALSFNHFLPTDMDGNLGDIVTGLPCAAAEVEYDVLSNEPRVEASILESPNGLAIALVNWTPIPQDVRISVQYVPPGFNFASSVRHGPLDSIRLGKSVDFKTRVEVADMILLEK